MTKRSDSYVMTIDPLSTTDMEKVSVLRKSVSAMNKLEKTRVSFKKKYYGVVEQPILWRVSLRGRLGKGNPAARRYDKSYFHSVRLEDAQRIDVYVQRRIDYS